MPRGSAGGSGVWPVCLPWPSSIFFAEHDRQHPLGDGRIAGVGRVELKIEIEIVDLKNDPSFRDSQHGAIVLAPGIIVFGEVVKLRHRGEHVAYSVGAER